MKAIWRPVGVVAGAALILVGIPLFLTPLPGGLAAIAVGAALLISSSRRVQRFVRRKRDKHPKMNGRLNHLEEKVPHQARGPLEKTRPD